jgi:peptidylprolyl isomerase
MRTFFALLMLFSIGAGCWYGYHALNKPVDTTAQTQADAFVSAALAALNNATSTASSTQPSLPAASTSPSQATIPGDSQNQTTNPVTNSNDNKKYMHAILHTSMGDITIEFFKDDAPNTVANFVKLANDGFYNGTKFHRVIAGFMIQGGDPLTKDDSMAARWGTGGPGYTFNDEIRANNHNVIGTISMANSGPNTNGSQFFINVANNGYLDGKHTTFGKVIGGMNVVDAIQHTPTDAGDRPATPVVVSNITLSE